MLRTHIALRQTHCKTGWIDGLSDQSQEDELIPGKDQYGGHLNKKQVSHCGYSYRTSLATSFIRESNKLFYSLVRQQQVQDLWKP